jgi:hypothetical protein
VTAAASVPASAPAPSPAPSLAVERPASQPTVPRDKSFVVGLGLGLATNFTAVVSPTLYLEAGALLPVLQRRLAVLLRASAHFARISSASEPGATATEVATALSLCLRYAHPLPWLTVSAVLGPALGIAYAEIDVPTRRVAVVQAVGGIDAGVGAARSLGPGEIFLELAYRWLRHDTAVFSFDAGGFLAALGYRLAI